MRERQRERERERERERDVCNKRVNQPLDLHNYSINPFMKAESS
jgi:hypothetical protein